MIEFAALWGFMCALVVTNVETVEESTWWSCGIEIKRNVYLFFWTGYTYCVNAEDGDIADCEEDCRRFSMRFLKGM